jgi:hypothetical protein
LFLNRTETVAAKKNLKKSKIVDEDIPLVKKSAPVKKQTSLDLKKQKVSTKVTKQIKKTPVKKVSKVAAKSSKKPV